MKLELRPWAGTEASEVDLRGLLEREGFSVWRWTDAAGATYASHHHDHDESIVCVAGEITFRAAGKSLTLHPGDRLMLPKGTPHTAEVGNSGATYLIGER